MKSRRRDSTVLSDAHADIAAALTGRPPEIESDGEDSYSWSLSIDTTEIPLGKRLPVNDDQARVKFDNEIDGKSDDDDEGFIASHVAASNRKTSTKPKSSRKTGGFQSMGIGQKLMKAIVWKGFSVPTPIQRKTMPLILDGQDVVGMARTGSGKTAAFVIPMIEKLKAHKAQVGTRALVLSPSRELAIQSLKAVKEFGKGTDLRTLLIVGGDSLDEQFSQMTSNPDIIIATPGRFLHLLIEMSLDLSYISYTVFDEADRLFEMGFQTQLTEILHALPPSRQTLLFSATLPKSLVEFACAGLKEPQLVRLDTETKISPDLENAFLTIKSEDKDGALLYLLSDVIRMPQRHTEQLDQQPKLKKRKRDSNASTQAALDPPTDQSSIVFAASQKQVEFLTNLLSATGYAVSFVYGNLDQAARNVQIEKFRNGTTTVLVVTDVAARGIDIPMLANVINYDFPAQPKIFVHRVGRTARAGRRGWSFNFVETADLPYLLDLQLFLNRKLIKGRDGLQPGSFAKDIVIGGLPGSDAEPSCEYVGKLLESDVDLSLQRTVALRAKAHYTRTRSSASAESAHRAKDLAKAKELQEPHPIFYVKDQQPINAQRDDLLARIRGFRPVETVFELGRRGEEHQATKALRKQKLRISDKKLHAEEANKDARPSVDDLSILDLPKRVAEADVAPQNSSKLAGDLPHLEREDDSAHFSDEREKPLRGHWQDYDNFMSYQPREMNLAEDKGYGVRSGSERSNFVDAARNATMELDDDEISRDFGEPSRMRWDKRSKKYVSQANDEDGSKGKRLIAGESGQRLAASFRSGRFDAWKKANRIDRLARPGEKEAPVAARSVAGSRKFKHSGEKAPKQPDKYRDDYHKRKKKMVEKLSREPGIGATRPAKNELRSVDNVRKQRLLKQKRREKNARPSKKHKR